MTLVTFHLFQAFRVATASSTAERSQVGVVTMTITITDINDNSPVILNPTAATLSVLEVIWLNLVFFTFGVHTSINFPPEM